MKYQSYKDDKTSYDDGALYVIYYKEMFDNGTYRNHLVLRHAFSLEQAERNFNEECQAKGINFRLYRIFQAYESRRYFYEEVKS